MNPALMALYLDQNGQFNRQGYNNHIMDDYYQSMGMQTPQVPDMSWLEDYNKVPVPGTRGTVEAPKLPAPQPVQQQLTPDQEYEMYGTIHGIVPDPNSHYDTAPTSPAPPGSEGYMGASNSSPISSGAQAAMQTARASYDMDEEQRRRALGLGMVKFFSNYAASNNASRLGALNESFNPAVEAFIAERDKALRHNFEQKKFDADQEEYQFNKELKIKEHERKMAQKKFEGMTVAQQQAVKDKLITRAFKIEERKQIELDNYVKNHLQHARGAKKDELIAKRKEEIDKKWARQESVVRNEMKQYGLEPEDLVAPSEPAAPAGVTSSSTSPISAGGVPDFSKMTDAEFNEYKRSKGL